jgi:hypothetical protein
VRSPAEKERLVALVNAEVGWQGLVQCDVFSHDPIDWGTIGKPLSGEPGICT